MQHVAEVAFWVALGKIVWVNILLSGDNAVVIALAARSLPEHQRQKAVIAGSAAAIVMRVLLTLFAVELLHFPYLKLIGALLLFWIGVQLLLPEDEHGEGVESSSNLWGAVRTILVADLVMSLDNVIAVAAAAESGPPESRLLLLIIGLGLSIPLIIFGSQLLMKVMSRYPIIITLGAALLGFVAGEMLVSDKAVDRYFSDFGTVGITLFELAGAIGVVLVGKWLTRRRAEAQIAKAALARGGDAAPAQASASGALGRILVAVDGSPGSALAVQRALALRRQLGAAADLHFVNVQRPVMSDAARFVDGKALEAYHREQADLALAGARAQLADAGLTATEHMKVGEPGPTIAETARELGCDLVMVGAHGLGTSAAAILGSVAQDTIAHASQPVMVVK